MRTTLTLDDDVARKLKEAARRKQVPFKQIVNDTLRAGLAVKRKPRQVSGRFKVEATRCGFFPGIDAGKLNQLTDEIEAAEHVAEETSR